MRVDGRRWERIFKRTTIGNHRAQSLIEFGVLMAMVCAVIVAIEIYAKRAVQGRLKASADEIGEQFSPRWSNFTSRTTSHQRSQETLSEEGESSSTLLDHAFTRRGPYVDDFSNRRLTDEQVSE